MITVLWTCLVITCLGIAFCLGYSIGFDKGKKTLQDEPETKHAAAGVYYNPAVRERVEEEYKKLLEDKKILSKACATKICPSCGGYFKLMNKSTRGIYSDYKCTTCGLKHTQY